MTVHKTDVVVDTLGGLVYEGPNSAQPTSPASSPASSPAASPAASQAFQTEFACMQLQYTDRITLVNFPRPAVDVVRQAILDHWPKPIQREEPMSARRVSFKLRGNPWLGAGPEIMQSRRLTMRLLEALARAGWVLSLSTGILTRHGQQKDSLFFRHQEPAPAPCEWVCLAFSSTGAADMLRLIDCPDDLSQDLASVLESRLLISKHGKADKLDDVYDLHLRNMMLRTCTGLDGQEMMLVLLSQLEKHGFTVLAAIDQTDSFGRPDTWHCCRPLNWEKGQPVFHR